MRHRLTLLMTPLVGLVLIAACDGADVDDDTYAADDDVAMAEEQVTAYADWDADSDNFLDETEFDSWWNEERDRWDWNTDAEDGLTRDEFSEGVFFAWDRNDDDRVDEDEWRTGADNVWGAGRYDFTLSDWDGDGDSELDANEVREGFEREGLYDTVDGDRDALIDDEELADWFFDIFDADDDSRIDTTEWESTWLEDNR